MKCRWIYVAAVLAGVLWGLWQREPDLSVSGNGNTVVVICADSIDLTK